MAIQIQFRRGTASEWSSVNPILALAEMGIETDTDLFKIGNGVDAWNDLDYGGVQGPVGPTGYTGSIGSIAVDNVLYVSKSGNDAYDGTSLGTSKLTIKSALEIATPGTTIFVKSGDYTEINPMTVPENVSIIGDNLRSVTVRPANVTEDLFYVNNGVYLAHMTFKDHESPAAAVSFNPDGSAGVIYLSPYVQNCTSMTTTGTGMRVDGSHSAGLKSMVVDAFTQYNQGGIGIHMLNQGYTQLVSVFTICCDVGILCESGGFCSVTNSNSSFGNYALKADGLSNALYTGTVQIATGTVKSVVLNGLLSVPNIGDAMMFSTTSTIFTVESATDLVPASIEAIVGPTFTNETSSLKNARSTILDAKSKIQVDTIDYINETFLNFTYDDTKCSRDTGLIVESLAFDLLYEGTSQSTFAGLQYWSQGNYVDAVGDQITTTTNAINYVKTLVTATATTAGGTGPAITLGNRFDDILYILENGVNGVTDDIIDNSTTSTVSAVFDAYNAILAAKESIQNQTIEWINTNNPDFVYSTSTCFRDVGYIIDSVAFDLLHGGNKQSIMSGVYYYGYNTSTIHIPKEVPQTVAAYTFLKGLVADVITATPVSTTYQETVTQDTSLDPATASEVTTIQADIDIIIDIIRTGPSAAGSKVPIGLTASTDTNVANAFALLKANKDFIKAETIAYINTEFVDFEYNQAICSRDVGYIIDAVADDMVLNTNYKSVYAGSAYYRAVSSVVTSTQKVETVYALEFVKDQVLESLLTNYTTSSTEYTRVSDNLDTVITILNTGTSAIPSLTFNSPTSVDPNREYARDILQANRAFLIEEGSAYIDANYPLLVYNTSTCRRDMGYIIDAITYDLIYSGNSETANAADEYYSFGVLQIPTSERQATIDTFNYIGSVAASCVTNTSVTPLNVIESQVSGATPATSTEADIVTELFTIVTDLIENGYSSTVTLEERIPDVEVGTTATFHQFSLITSSGHTFEWVGAGTNISASLPSFGGVPLQENQIVEVNGGRIYYTSTDQKGDFRIGNDFVINRKTGTISGRTFTKSMFAVMTPYMLAIGR